MDSLDFFVTFCVKTKSKRIPHAVRLILIDSLDFFVLFDQAKRTRQSMPEHIKSAYMIDSEKKVDLGLILVVALWVCRHCSFILLAQNKRTKTKRHNESQPRHRLCAQSRPALSVDVRGSHLSLTDRALHIPFVRV